MIESSSEHFIGEMLMHTTSLPANLWNLIITDKGIHFICFRKLPLFEIITLILIWSLISLAALSKGFNKIAVLSFILLLISIVYILDRYKIQNRWDKFVKMTIKEKIFSASSNIHIKKSDIRKIFVDNNNIIISTNNKTYKFSYHNDGFYFYKNGIDPFQMDDMKLSANKKEIDIEKIFLLEYSNNV